MNKMDKAIESRQETRCGSDTHLAVPATLLRIDHIVDNFYCTCCLSSFDSTVLTKSFVSFKDSFHVECT